MSVSQQEIGAFIDSIAGDKRTPAAIAGRLIEEVIELALASGMPPGKIFEHVADSLHNQALKASDTYTIFPSQLPSVATHGEQAEEAADVSIILKDFCHVAGIDLGAHETLKWEKFKTKTFRVVDSGVVYTVKSHIR